VLIASTRALCAQGNGGEKGPYTIDSLRRGLANLQRHLDNLQKFHVPVVIAINRFPDDSDDLLREIRLFASERDVPAAIVEAYSRGGDGAIELAEAVLDTLDNKVAAPEPLYKPEVSLRTKIETVAREIYGAAAVYIESKAKKKLERYMAAGFGHLPVCMAKTQSSFTDNPKIYGAPSGWTLTITDADLAAGAGFVVVIAGNMMRMPGLGREPQAVRMDVDAAGNIIGLR